MPSSRSGSEQAPYLNTSAHTEVSRRTYGASQHYFPAARTGYEARQREPSGSLELSGEWPWCRHTSSPAAKAKGSTVLLSTRGISHGGNTVQLDTAQAPCKCTRGSSSDGLSADGGAFGATMPEPFASDGDTAGWPRDSEESPTESLSDDATDYNSDECAVLSDGESSWEESDHTDDSLEDQDKLAASADQLDHLHAPAEDTSPTALELAIQEDRDVDAFEASALMGALATVPALSKPVRNVSRFISDESCPSNSPYSAGRSLRDHRPALPSSRDLWYI